MKTAAIVVTYNRKELLSKTLKGLETQKDLDHVIVIDNASTDETWDFLNSREFSVEHTLKRLKKNTGGAGGFTYGIEIAYGLGFDAFWLMDDDTVPRENSLDPMLKALQAQSDEDGGNMPSFACSMVLWKDGSLCEMNTPETTWDWPRSMTKNHPWQLVKSCSFVSCLVTREAVHAVGLPYREYFIWADDLEYTTRLSKWRPGIFVPESRVDHLLAQNRGVNWSDVNENNLWKFLYGARNNVSAAISLRSMSMLSTLIENMIKQLMRSDVPPKLKLKVIKAALSGLFFRPKKRFARTVR